MCYEVVEAGDFFPDERHYYSYHQKLIVVCSEQGAFLMVL